MKPVDRWGEREGHRMDPQTDNQTPPASAQAVPLTVRLEFLSGSRRDDIQVLAAPGEYTVGCREDCAVRFDRPHEPFVSGHHLEIVLTDERAEVRDLDSRNGTFVNGQQIETSTRLYCGDVVVLGYDGPRFRFSSDGEHYVHPVVGRSTVVMPKPERPTPAAEAEDTPAGRGWPAWVPAAACAVLGVLVTLAYFDQNQTARKHQDELQTLRGDIVEFKNADEKAVFTNLAPAVVVVSDKHGHGTGFFVRDEGLILSNSHVVTPAIQYDLEANASYVVVRAGTFDENGEMRVFPESLKAYFCKRDKHKDLALLKLQALPDDLNPPHVQLADAPPPPGTKCSIVGHPTSGMLWTYRAGKVASIGFAPHDIVDVYVHQLAAMAEHEDEEALREALDSMPRHKILLSTCGVNQGDSGSPVVDEKGKLIAVTFAKPRDPAKMEFSYNVHLDEVRDFLREPLPRPALLLPDVWEIGPARGLNNVDQSGKPDALIGGVKRAEDFLLDLDNDSTVPQDAEGKPDLAKLVREKAWDFEAAFQIRGEKRMAYYDTDNDDALDLILLDKNGDRKAELGFVREDGVWRVRDGEQAGLMDEKHIPDPALRRRFWKLTRLLFR